jgi:hypothetical protein
LLDLVQRRQQIYQGHQTDTKDARVDGDHAEICLIRLRCGNFLSCQRCDVLRPRLESLSNFFRVACY